MQIAEVSSTLVKSRQFESKLTMIVIKVTELTTRERERERDWDRLGCGHVR